MKRLRIWLIIMPALATVLLGLYEFGGTPISKDFDTWLKWRPDDPIAGPVLSASPGGNITCRIRLRIPATPSVMSADASSGAHLRVTPESTD